MGVTDGALLQRKRTDIVATVGNTLSVPLIKRTRALYWSSDHKTRIACSFSKRYTKRGAYPYWYAYHPQWDEFLREGERGLFVLGCMDQPFAYAVPRDALNSVLPALNTTTTDKGTYWHIHLVEGQGGDFSLLVPKETRALPLDRFRIELRGRAAADGFGDLE